MALFISSNWAFATDAKTYVLMPSTTDITEFRVAYSEVTAFASPVKTTNLTKLVKHAHYFGVNGNLAAAYLTVPYIDLKQTNNDVTMAKQSGFGDPTFLFAMGVYNTPALTLQEYIKHDKSGLTAACSLSVIAPWGSYQERQALNVGGKRYTAKPECQMGYGYKRMLFEVIGGMTYYGENDTYLGNNLLQQDNLYHVETHVSYSFTPKLWVSADAFYINGGNAQLNGRNLNRSQNSVSLGSVMGYTIDKNQLVKLIYQKTVNASRTSQKLEGVAVSYNYLW